jgi:hypothetical protein
MSRLNFHETPKSSFCLSSFTQNFHKTSFIYNTHLPQPTKFNKLEQLENSQTRCETWECHQYGCIFEFHLAFFPFLPYLLVLCRSPCLLPEHGVYILSFANFTNIFDIHKIKVKILTIETHHPKWVVPRFLFKSFHFFWKSNSTWVHKFHVSKYSTNHHEGKCCWW